LEQFLFKKGSANVLFADIIVPVFKNYINQQRKGCHLQSQTAPVARDVVRNKMA
jgi:hypothetical protein